jgi:hypothetical protein
VRTEDQFFLDAMYSDRGMMIEIYTNCEYRKSIQHSISVVVLNGIQVVMDVIWVSLTVCGSYCWFVNKNTKRTVQAVFALVPALTLPS